MNYLLLSMIVLTFLISPDADARNRYRGCHQMILITCVNNETGARRTFRKSFQIHLRNDCRPGETLDRSSVNNSQYRWNRSRCATLPRMANGQRARTVLGTWGSTSSTKGSGGSWIELVTQGND